LKGVQSSLAGTLHEVKALFDHVRCSNRPIYQISLKLKAHSPKAVVQIVQTVQVVEIVKTFKSQLDKFEIRNPKSSIRNHPSACCLLPPAGFISPCSMPYALCPS